MFHFGENAVSSASTLHNQKMRCQCFGLMQCEQMTVSMHRFSWKLEKTLHEYC